MDLEASVSSPENPEDKFLQKFNNPSQVEVQALRDLHELNEAKMESESMLEQDSDDYVEDTTLGILSELLVARVTPLLIYERILRRQDTLEGYASAYKGFSSAYDELVAFHISQGNEYSFALQLTNSFISDLLLP